MAALLAIATSIRNSMLQQISDAIDGGAGAGLLRVYDGTRPATGGTATTLLAELTFSDPCAATITGGVLTFDSITSDSSANADGTATWCRAVDSTGTFVFDANVGTSSADFILNTTAVVTGQTVSCTSATITDGNS